MKKVRKALAVGFTLLVGVVGLSAGAAAMPPQEAAPGTQDAVAQTIDGIWYNELGSKVILRTQANGDIVGLYESAVGSATGQYRLSGRLHLSPAPGTGTPLGWTVTWLNEYRNSNSATSWSGQFRDGPEGPAIITQWLLTSGTAPADDWSSTRVGHDRFTRTPPTARQIDQALARGVTSSSPDRLTMSQK